LTNHCTAQSQAATENPLLDQCRVLGRVVAGHAEIEHLEILRQRLLQQVREPPLGRQAVAIGERVADDGNAECAGLLVFGELPFAEAERVAAVGAHCATSALEKKPRASAVVVTSRNTQRVAYSAATVARLSDVTSAKVTAMTRPTRTARRPQRRTAGMAAMTTHSANDAPDALVSDRQLLMTRRRVAHAMTSSGPRGSDLKVSRTEGLY
jgi:hypothetical protein